MSLPDQGKSIKSSRRWEIISSLLAFFASPKQRVQPLVRVHGERRLASLSKPLVQVVSDTAEDELSDRLQQLWPRKCVRSQCFRKK